MPYYDNAEVQAFESPMQSMRSNMRMSNRGVDVGTS